MGAGKGRAHAGRGKGAVAAYVEDNQAYDMDGAFISSLTVAETDYYDHDEEAHTTLATEPQPTSPTPTAVTAG